MTGPCLGILVALGLAQLDQLLNRLRGTLLAEPLALQLFAVNLMQLPFHLIELPASDSRGLRLTAVNAGGLVGWIEQIARLALDRERIGFGR